MKRFLCVLLIAFFVVNLFPLKTNYATASESSSSDFSVILDIPDKTEAGQIIDIVATVSDISYPVFDGGKGIFGAAVFLYYDSEFFTPVEDSFKATVPNKWDSFDGTSTTNVWAFYAVFDGTLSNGAVTDGDISFKASFKVNESATPQKSHFVIKDCECTGYDSKSIVKVKSYNATANCDKIIEITSPDVLMPTENCPFTIDKEKGIIYSHTPELDYNKFTSYFSISPDNVSISAFDYEITAENGKNIPNGANVSVYHTQTGKTYQFTYYLLGDCDCNGLVSISDLAVIKTVIVNEIPVENHVLYSIDFEKDTVVRLSDYLRLKKYIYSNILIYN